MGPDIYVLGLSLLLRLNSEKRAKFKITVDTLMTFAREFFLPKKETDRVVIMLFKVPSVFLSVLENQRTIVDIRIYIFTRIRSTAKTKLHYVADIVLDRKDSPYL